MSRADFAKQLYRFMNRYDRFLLSGHIRPDGDRVGVCTALGLALMDMGKEVRIVFDGDPSRYTSIVDPVPALPEDMEIQDAGKCFETGNSFVFIMMDCSEPDRTGRAGDAIMAAEASMSIDHHVTSKETADFNYVESDTGSTCEILYGLFKLAGVPVTLPIANALFMGTAFDTGGFRHSNTTADTYAMAADLKSMGVDSTFYMNYLFHSRGFMEARAMSKALQNARLYDDQILISCMSAKDFFMMGMNAKDADGVVGSLIEIEEAEVACYLREIEDGVIRVNMRSKAKVDVARIAALFGGGGHVRAAGCTCEEPMLLVKEELLEAIRRQLAEGAEG